MTSNRESHHHSVQIGANWADGVSGNASKGAVPATRMRPAFIHRDPQTRPPRRHKTRLILLALASSVAVAVTGCAGSMTTPTIGAARTAEVTINATTNPIDACSSLFPSYEVARYLSYENRPGLSLNPERTKLADPASSDGRRTLHCGFVDNDRPDNGYEIRVAPAMKGGQSGIVTAQGVTISGTSVGISPKDIRHLIPLFTAAATRADFQN